MFDVDLAISIKYLELRSIVRTTSVSHSHHTSYLSQDTSGTQKKEDYDCGRRKHGTVDDSETKEEINTGVY